MTDKYILKEVMDFQEWNDKMKLSKQWSIFNHSEYLKCAVNKFKLFFVYKKNLIKAGVSIVLTDDEKSCKFDDLVIYNGIFFLEDKDQKKVKTRYEQFEITEFIINKFAQYYHHIELSLSPSFEDIRPFLWHNYHSDNRLDKYDTTIKYTSYINIEELKVIENDEESILFSEMETLRKRNIREGKKQKAKIEECDDVSLFINFYKKLMENQNELIEQEKLNQMEKLIINLLNNDMAKMFCLKNHEGNILYMIVFCYDQHRAYYLFGAGNPETNERYKGTSCFWESFKILSQKYDIKEIDMEGVNSPKRGWFKLSFGGDLRSYIQVSK